MRTEEFLDLVEDIAQGKEGATIFFVLRDEYYCPVKVSLEATTEEPAEKFVCVEIE